MSDPADKRSPISRWKLWGPAKGTSVAQGAAGRRLSLLVRLATVADLWERLWRAAIPSLVVVGLFLCVSWLGLWLDVPHFARQVGVAGFGLLLLASCYNWLKVAPLSRRDALKRIDRASGVGHGPASLLEDALANPGRDPATDALWALHKRRAEAAVSTLRAGRPSPRAVDLDRFALRGGILAALLACAVIAGPQRYARVAAAFDFGTASAGGVSARLDAWIDPPPYTGKAPVLLDLASARDTAHPRRLSAPAGSVVVIRSSGGRPATVETSGPLLPFVPKGSAPRPDGQGKDPSEDRNARAPVPGESETRLVLHGDARLTVRQDGRLRGVIDLVAVPDRPPTIALRAVPRANARGSLTLAYGVGDDYGVASAEALLADPAIDGTPTEAKPLVAAPKVPLALPGVTNGLGDAETTADLSDSPWAGAQVRMTLVARDEGGNEGRGEPATLTLPEKPFANPLARALVEQRRDLVLNPSHRATVGTALDALAVAPEAFGTTASVYLGLRFAADSLAQARTDAQLVAVADFLWDMALQLENGDLSDAERALRNAEKDLRDAIDRHAPDAEIQKLTQNLQAAMDSFLKELAQQQKDGDQQAQDQSGRPAKSISPKDLQKLIDRLKEQARSGNREEAKKALDELQDVLENLKTAKRQKPDPQSRAMAEGLNQLDQAMRDQQDLRDETFKKDQQGRGQDQPGQDQPGQDQQGQDQGQGQDQEQRGEDGNGGQQGQMRGGGGMGRQPGQGAQGQAGQGRAGQSQQGRSQQEQSQQGRSPQGQGRQGGGQQGQAQQGQAQQGQAQQGLGQRQQALRDRLAAIQKKLKAVGKGEGSLAEAGQAMREAEQALGQGEDAGDQAVDAQGRALEAMRKGAKELADAMNKQGEGEGQADAEGEGGQGSQGGEANGDADPLGRPRGGTSATSNSRFDPLGVPAAQRASRVLEELRRRLADPARAQEEIDYLERLLRSY